MTTPVAAPLSSARSAVASAGSDACRMRAVTPSGAGVSGGVSWRPAGCGGGVCFSRRTTGPVAGAERRPIASVQRMRCWWVLPGGGSAPVRSSASSARISGETGGCGGRHSGNAVSRSWPGYRGTGVACVPRDPRNSVSAAIAAHAPPVSTRRRSISKPSTSNGGAAARSGGQTGAVPGGSHETAKPSGAGGGCPAAGATTGGRWRFSAPTNDGGSGPAVGS